MGFSDVNDIEFDVVFVLLVNSFQGISLTPEGRSRVGSEDQGDRLLARKAR